MKSKLEKKAEMIFYIVADEIIKVMGSSATFQFDLEKVAKGLIGKEFAGVFAVDSIEFPKGTKYAIFNLDKESEPGSHWMGLVKGKNKFYVYDSFGRPSKEIAPSLFKKGLVVLDSDRDQDQSNLSEVCGPFALSWVFVAQNFGIKTAMLI